MKNTVQEGGKMKPKYFLFLFLLFTLVSISNAYYVVLPDDYSSSDWKIELNDGTMTPELIEFTLASIDWAGYAPNITGIYENRIYFASESDMARFCSIQSYTSNNLAFSGEFLTYIDGKLVPLTVVYTDGAYNPNAVVTGGYLNSNCSHAQMGYLFAQSSNGDYSQTWVFNNDVQIYYCGYSASNPQFLSFVHTSNNCLTHQYRGGGYSSRWSRLRTSLVVFDYIEYEYVPVAVTETITELYTPPTLYELTLNSNVDDFEVYNNLQLLGTYDSGDTLHLLEGEYDLSFKKDGYYDSDTITINVPDNDSVECVLQKIPTDFEVPVESSNYFIVFDEEQNYTDMHYLLENTSWDCYEPVFISTSPTRLDFESAKDLARFMIKPNNETNPLYFGQYKVFYDKKLCDIERLDFEIDHSDTTEIYKTISTDSACDMYVYADFGNISNRTVKIKESNTTDDSNAYLLATAIGNETINPKTYFESTSVDSIYFSTNASTVSEIKGSGTVLIFEDVDIYETGHTPWVFTSTSTVYPKYDVIFILNTPSVSVFDNILAIYENDELVNHDLPQLYLGTLNNGDKIKLVGGVHELSFYKDGYVSYTTTITLQSALTVNVDLVDIVSTTPASTVAIVDDPVNQNFVVTITEPEWEDVYKITFTTLYNTSVMEKPYYFANLDSNTQIVYDYDKIFTDLGIAEVVDNETEIPEGNYVINVEIEKNDNSVSNKNFLIVISPPPERTFTTLAVLALMIGVISYVIIAPFSKNAPFSFILAGLTVGVFQEVFQIGTLGKITAGLFFALSVLSFIFTEFQKRG